MAEDIVVIGHKNPDTDSICAALGYAYVKNQLGVPAIAGRTGKLNAETEYVLAYFQQEAPVLVDDLYPRLENVQLLQPPVVGALATLREVGKYFVEKRPKAIPILNEKQAIEGLITVNDLAMRYYDELSIQDLDDAEVDFASIVRTLEGELLCGDLAKRFAGDIRIGASHALTLHNSVKAGDLIILGDREDAQAAALEADVCGLVLTRGTQPTPAIRALALEKQAIIISTKYDTYTTVRLIHQSIPVKFLMQRELEVFKRTDLLADVKEKLRNSERSVFPVVEHGRYVGMIDRGCLLNPKRKKVILVDHNERGQAVEGIEQAELLEIIDHHRLGGLTSGQPIFIRQEPVGSTSTIVANLAWHRNVELTATIAGLLLAAIISDTLYFRSPTVTEVDRVTAAKLAEIAGIANLEQFAFDLIAAGSVLNTLSAEEIVRNDVKEFEIGKTRVCVGQITIMNGEAAKSKFADLEAALEKMVKQGECELALLMVTDIMAESTELLAAGGARIILDKAFGSAVAPGRYALPGVLSRKKQVIPPLTEAFRE